MSGSTQVATTTTDSNGDYTFTNVFPGSYTIAVVRAVGLRRDVPSSGTLSVTAPAGQTVNNLDFGEFQTVTVSGEVFDDRPTAARSTRATRASRAGPSSWYRARRSCEPRPVRAARTRSATLAPGAGRSKWSSKRAGSRPTRRSPSLRPAGRTSRERTSARSRSPQSCGTPQLPPPAATGIRPVTGWVA